MLIFGSSVRISGVVLCPRPSLSCTKNHFNSPVPPCVLNGYTKANLPWLWHLQVSRFIPVTYYIRILRGIVLRGAGFRELWLNAAILLVMGITTTLIAARLFVRQKARINFLSGTRVEGSLDQLLSTSDQLCPQVSRILV